MDIYQPDPSSSSNPLTFYSALVFGLLLYVLYILLSGTGVVGKSKQRRSTGDYVMERKDHYEKWPSMVSELSCESKVLP